MIRSRGGSPQDGHELVDDEGTSHIQLREVSVLAAEDYRTNGTLGLLSKKIEFVKTWEPPEDTYRLPRSILGNIFHQ